MRTTYFKTLSISAGCLLGLCLVVGVDWVFGRLTQGKSRPIPAEASQRLPHVGLTNRQILGVDATTHGIFPEFPLQASHETEVFTPPADTLSYRKNRPRKSWGYWGPDQVHTWVDSGHETFFHGKDVIVDRAYTIDPRWARRLVPGEDAKHVDEFLIFGGCSYFFGDGLADDETLPYQVGKQLPHARVYNYGSSGSSTGEAWLRLKTIRTRGEIAESHGTVLYDFIDDDLARSMGAMSVIGTWGSGRHHFFLNGKGEPETDGPFRSVQPIRTAIFRLLEESNILRYFGVDIPWWNGDEDWRLLVRLVVAMKSEATRLGAGKFYLLFWPGSRLSTRMIPYLEKEKIDYIDYSHWEMGRLTRGPAKLAYDGHPTAEADRILADSLVQVLQAGGVHADTR
jgi:hypothetical protein